MMKQGFLFDFKVLGKSKTSFLEAFSFGVGTSMSRHSIYCVKIYEIKQGNKGLVPVSVWTAPL